MPPANSTMLALGTTAPEFALPAPDGSVHSLEDCMGDRGLLVAFICNHCPYVKHIFSELTALGHELPDLGLGMVGIMSNDIENYPADAPDKMAETAREQDWRFPYLVDASQEVAKAYTAACTPDFFLFDADHALVYRGQLDESRPNSETPVTGDDLRAAIAALTAGNAVAQEQTPSLGCGIKWIPGQAPAYMS
jgi:peroxiredoxin